jgi:hypothetical protein
MKNNEFIKIYERFGFVWYMKKKKKLIGEISGV